MGKTSQIVWYNNPYPSPGSTNYGYDVWMTVAETFSLGGKQQIQAGLLSE